jgi:peptidoglycan recognition protein
MDVNEWGDISFSFYVGGDGNVYEGRGWFNQGLKSPSYDVQSINICFIGTFSGEYFLMIRRSFEILYS